ncbi:uncharacterized protein LOC132556980 [Ylistrum balloti]|uniref:uncharacterized protein LOC132556980 n=1 Tax=Ylistrum balloti TaxID=509963 RepID=UPI002905D243|nr:uncharacterized protein LOC132556980 [Ylistrum balloti]
MNMLFHPRASTPINLTALKTALDGHPDENFVNFLLDGLTFGFDTGFQFLPLNSFECSNLKSALADHESVTDLVNKEVVRGYLLGPFDHIPYKNYRINPIGLAEHKYSKKKRLIVDMSAPHQDVNNPSLNSLIDKITCSLKYTSIDDAIRVIKELHQNAWLMKTDITDAFKLLPIKPELWPYHGICWDGKYYFFTRLVFGSRSSPKLFDNLSRAICWIAQNKYNIQHILHLLDDFLVIEPASAIATRTMSSFLKVFQDLNIPIGAHKTVGPVTCLEYLGVFLDSTRMECRLPAEKVSRIICVLESFANRKCCTKRELLSLLGHMNFATRCVKPGRSFVSHLISLSTSARELHFHVKLNAECRSDLNMWALFLRNWNGASFFLDDHVTSAADLHLFTDATNVAFGGIYKNQWFQGVFPAELQRSEPSMALFELYPIVMACVLWGHQWCKKRVLFHCDNMATVDIITKGRSKVKSIMRLVRTLTFHSAMYNFIVHARHIPGSDNNIADAISRSQMSRFRKLAPQADLHPVPCLPMVSIMMT